MSTARQFEDWEQDPAHEALRQWIAAWRSQRPEAMRPGPEFSRHIGEEAVALMAGMGKVELLRLFAAAGFDGQCVCGLDWTNVPLAELEAS